MTKFRQVSKNIVILNLESIQTIQYMTYDYTDLYNIPENKATYYISKFLYQIILKGSLENRPLSKLCI